MALLKSLFSLRMPRPKRRGVNFDMSLILSSFRGHPIFLHVFHFWQPNLRAMRGNVLTEQIPAGSPNNHSQNKYLFNKRDSSLVTSVKQPSPTQKNQADQTYTQQNQDRVPLIQTVNHTKHLFLLPPLCTH